LLEERYSNYTIFTLIFMKFEYDTDKSAANREKHGIDFDGAQAVSFLRGPSRPS